MMFSPPAEIGPVTTHEVQPVRSVTLIDLTKPLDPSLSIYHDGGYSDPPFICTTWCSIAERGFWVSRLELGTQTGTHIDAPAHFLAEGPTLESLPVDRLVGRYFLVDLPERCDRKDMIDRLEAYSGEPILFLRARAGKTALITKVGMECLLGLPPKVWTLSGTAVMENAPHLEFYRRLARAGIFLIEDVDETAAFTAPARGELIALPLRLVGAGGAPCRVVVRPLT